MLVVRLAQGQEDVDETEGQVDENKTGRHQEDPGIAEAASDQTTDDGAKHVTNVHGALVPRKEVASQSGR